MIKEILQENNNKSFSKEKINHKKLNTILNGFDALKKLNILKKSKQNNTYRKNKNLKLLFNKTGNIYKKKITNLKTTNLNRLNKEFNNRILYRNNKVPLDKILNYTSREGFRKNKMMKEESKYDNNGDNNIYITDRLNSNNNKLINNLDKEFEIRCLNKKLEQLKKKNSEMKQDLQNIKEKNNILKNETLNNQNYLSNILNSVKNVYKSFFKEKKNQKEENMDLKNFLLDLMDLNYNYENSILINTFFKNLEKMIQLSDISNNNEQIYSNISNLLKKKNKTLTDINTLKSCSATREEYLEFCNNLFQNFKTNDLESIFNYLIKIEAKNENDIKKIFDMRSILFSKDTSSSRRLNTHISMDKLKKNKKQNINLNYSDLQKFYIENNNSNNDFQKIQNMTEMNYGCLTERDKIINNKNSIVNLKNQTINRRKKVMRNNNLDIDKINKFLYSSKVNNYSFRSPSLNTYNNKEQNEFYKNKQSGFNLNTSINNLIQNNKTQNNINPINNENENDLNINRHKIISYNDNIKNNIHKRITSLKKFENYQPIYYK